MPCAFCGLPFDKAGGRARTGEHAFAKWLADFLPNPGEDFRHTIQTPEGEVLHEWNTQTLDVVARKVCENCNGGWMNDLENAARPYLKSAVVGNGRTFYEGGQRLLAAWAVKTALAVHLAVPDSQALPESHYRLMSEIQTRPPGCTQVWLGAYEGWRHGFQAGRHLTLHLKDGGTRDAYRVTFLVGHALFQVFGHVHDDEMTITKGATWDDMASQIWPVLGEVTFPPKLIVGEPILARFIDPGFREPGEAP